jgi:transposase-like protein
MPKEPKRTEIMTGGERRRRYSAEQKFRLFEGAKHCFAQAARHDGVSRGTPARRSCQACCLGGGGA